MFVNFPHAGTTVFFIGQGTGAIWLDNVVCTGNEARLYDCQNTGIGVHNCSHFEDVGIRCQRKQLCVCFSFTLITPNTQQEVRLRYWFIHLSSIIHTFTELNNCNTQQ